MGLDTTHNAWHGPYSSFNRLRHWLAQQIGINLDDYIGYGDKGTKELATIDHKIMPLLNHSDCDGHLSPSQCKQVGEGLQEIINNYRREQAGNLPPYDHSISAEQFMKGCFLAAKKKEKLEFH